jgi:transposase-like protein
MAAEISGQHDSQWAAISEVARLLGVGCAEAVRKWVRQAQVDRRPYTVDGFKLGKWVAKLETNTRSRGPSRDVR